MKINEVKSRTLKESIKNKLVESKKLLKEGTGNFYYENVCLYVSDEDYETGNVPEIEDHSIGYGRNFPQYPLVDYNNNLRFYSIVLTPGYYEGACIDYVEIDDNEVYDDILYDAEHNIDGYAFEDGKWTFQDVFMRHQGEEPKEVSEEEVIADIRNWVFKDYSVVTDEDIKQAIERYKKDDYYALSSFLVDSSIIDKIEKDLAKKELEVVKERIEQIKKDYGYRELQTVARFSNGETWYDYKESLSEKYGEIEYIIPVDFINDSVEGEDDIEDPIKNLERNYGTIGVEFLKVYNEDGFSDVVDVRGTTSELVAFLEAFTGMNSDEALDYINEFHIERIDPVNEELNEAAPKSRENLTGIDTFEVTFPSFTLKYSVGPGTQYDNPNKMWETNTYGDLKADSGELDRLEEFFVNALKQEIKSKGLKGVPVVGSSRLVPVPDVVHLEFEDTYED